MAIETHTPLNTLMASDGSTATLLNFSVAFARLPTKGANYVIVKDEPISHA